MLTFSEGRRIFLARAATDMRRSFDALASMVTNQFGKDPYAGDVFIFVGKHRNRVKVLVWDISGFWVCAKRLEKGTFAIPAPLLTTESKATLPLSPAEVYLLLEGIDVHRATYKQHYRRQDPAPAS